MSTEYANLGFRVDSSGLMTADQRLKNVTQSGKKTDAQVNTLNKTFGSLTSTLGLATTALSLIGAGMSVKGVIDYSDAWTNVNSQLRQVTENEKELASVREQLLNITRATRSELTNTVDLYATMTRSTTDLNISSERLMGVTKTLNNLFVAGGKPISETEGAIRQLNQGLAAGALRGDEFNSVAEGAPKVLDALTAKLSMTRGELRAFAATGGITSEVLISALEDYQVTAQKLADQTAKTFGQNLQNAKTNVTEFVGNSNALNSAVGTLGQGVEDLSENLDALAASTESVLYLAGGVAAFMGGKYVSSLVASEAAVIKQTLAQSASAKQTLAQTQAEVNLLRVQQQGYAGTILRIKSESTRDAVRKQLTGTTTALAAAEGRLATAQTAEAAAASRATVANIALNRARKAGSILTSAALGPWGLLAAAVGYGAISFMNAKEESDKLNSSLEKQEKEVSRLEKMYAAMTQGALGKSYVELQMSAIEIDTKRAAAIAEITKLEKEREAATAGLYGRGKAQAAKQFTDAIIEQRDKIESLDSQADVLSKRINLVNKAFEDGLPAISSTTSEVDKSASISLNAAKSYSEIVKSLENQRQQLILTSDEFEIYMVMQQASANNFTPAMTQQIIKQTKALQDQRKAIETTNSQLDNLMSGDLFGFGDDDSTDKISKDLDSLIGQVDNFGGAWTRTGNIIADSMGGAVSILDDFSSKMRTIEKLQIDLTKERKEYADGTKDAIRIDESLAKLQDESLRTYIGGLSKSTGLVSKMFSENSKERKALHAVEVSLSAIELAMALKTTVANAAAGASKFFAQSGWGGFAGVAAMSAVLAGFGFSMSGGGGSYTRPDEGGTGTVLGDSSAQSSSISNASERLEDIQTDQLSELMAIRQSMSQLSSGIQNLAKSFATDLDFNSASGELENSNFLDTKLGGILRKIDPIARAADWIDKLTGGLLGLGGVVDKIFGGFSSKKQKLIDSGITFVSQTMQDVFESGNLDASMFQVIETTKKKFWGLSKKKSTSTETTSISGAITSQMADIFGYIGDTVVAAANSLGMDAKHIITTGLESLSLDEALANFVIDIGDVSFADKTGEEIQKELEAIFSQQADLMAQYLVPSITEYQQVGEGAFETLQRVAYEQAIFNDALDRTGVSLKDLSNIMQIDIAQSIISLVGGVEEFSELANSFFDNFYSEAEQFNYLQSSISDVFSELGIGMVASRDEFRNLVEGIDLTTDSGQQLYAALMQVNPAMAEYFNALDDLARDKLGLQIELLNAQGKSEEALAMQRQMELDALDESLHSLQLQVWAQQDLNKAREEERQLLTDNVAFAEQQLEKARQAEIARINSTVEAAEEAYNSTLESINLQREAYNKLINELQSSVDEAASNLQASLNAELSKYDDLISASKERASEEISLINSISSARVSALSSELSLISGIASQYGESSVGVSASEALRAARAGNFEPATRVQTGSNFANATEARISKAREDFALAEIGKLADAQMSDLERTISATESSAQSQIDAINAASEREVAELESQRAAVEEQIKGILGITDTVLSLDEATAQYQKAQDDLQNALAENTLDKLQAQENIALQSLEQAREDAQKQIDALNEQVDSLLNIDNSVSSVDEAIKLLLAERKELAEFEKTMQESQLDTQVQTLQAVLSVESAINESAKAISDMYKDIVLVNKEPPNEMPPITVYPSSAGEDKMSQEIKSMKETMESQNRSIAKSSATTAKILQRIELGGLEVR